MTAYVKSINALLEEGGHAAYEELIAAHERDITCPWCEAKPGQRCHIIFQPEKIIYTVHKARTAHLRALWNNGWERGWKARDDAAQRQEAS